MAPEQNFFIRNKGLIIYGISLALLLFLLKWFELRFIIFDHSLEVYIGFIAVLFTALGIWLAMKLTRPRVETRVVEKEKTIVVEKEVYITREEFVFNEAEADKLGVSKRELEVLELMAQGCSNQEIASRLYLSLSTIKTHSSNLFEKLDVKRRTQAIEKAKKLSLIP
ncbi:MAG TPA: LuxR C-terminal-related transcriptional regulator [Ferruginibacter sp.]|nr:LuxR C-terminal-related transcriptional regulator [Ferruginibacter sp.]